MVPLLSGCVPDSRYREVIAEYQQGSATLQRAAEALFVNANRVDAENYIVKQAAAGGLLAQDEIDKQVVLSAEGLALRRDAIAALSQYTAAMAAVASGTTEDQIAADAAAAGTSISGLTADVQAEVAKDNQQANTKDWSGPITAAVSAAGEVIQLVEKHRSRVELRASLQKNDPAMKRLYELIAGDAEALYYRQRQTLELRGVVLYTKYEAQRTAQSSTGEYELLEMGDRIRTFRRDRELIVLSDPKPAFDAWKSSHDELVSVILQPDTKKQKESLAQVVADVRVFVAAVEPLAANLQILVAGF